MGKNLLRRVLPLLLSIAMVATAVPTNVMAAVTPADELVQEVVAEDASLGEVSTLANDNVGEEAGKLDAEITGNVSAILGFDPDSNNIYRIYRSGNEYPLSTCVDDLKAGLHIQVGDSTRDDLKSFLSFKWQQYEKDAYVDMAEGTAPSLAGFYKVIFTLDEDKFNAEPLEVQFEIVKEELRLSLVDFNGSVGASGITAQQAADNIINNNVKLFDEYNSDISSDLLGGKTYSDQPTYDIKEAFVENAPSLSSNDILLKGKDYTIELNFPLKEIYENDYEFIQIPAFNAVATEYRNSKVTIENLVDGYGMPLYYDFTGDEIAAPTASQIKVTVEGEIKTGEWEELTPAEGEITYAWLDANGSKLDSAPTAAGEYKYEVTYKDSTGIYAEAKQTIVIHISPVKLVIEPVYDDASYSLYESCKAEDVLKNVKYNLYKEDAAGNLEAFADYASIDKKFFGVTYNDEDATQYLVPIFRVEQGVKTKTDKDFSWSPVPILAPSSGTDKNGTEYAYRVVFTGKKGFRYQYGYVDDTFDINDSTANSADRSYMIDKSVVKTASVTINPSANAEIDVTDILIDGKGISYNGIYSKIYDEKPLYETRKEYKKAKVISANEVIAKETDDKLTYTWFEIYADDLYEVKDESGEPVLDEEGHQVYEVDTDLLTPDRGTTVVPKNAGHYALKVSFYDETGKYVAAPKYVFYEIDQQLLKVIPDQDSIPVGFAVSEAAYNSYPVGKKPNLNDFFQRLNRFGTYKIYRVPNNDRSISDNQLEDVTEKFVTENNYYKSIVKDGSDLYSARWVVYEYEGLDVETAGRHPIIWSDYFKEDVPYRVTAELDFTDLSLVDPEYGNYQIVKDNLYFTNYTNQYLDYDEDGNTQVYYYNTPVEPEIKKMGEREISIAIDNSKINHSKTYDGKGFDITDAIDNGYITVTDVATGEKISSNSINLTYKWATDSMPATSIRCSSGLVSPSDVETYTLYVGFAGDETYKYYSYVKDSVPYNIKKRDVVITIPIKDEITAGYASSVVDFEKDAITGFIPEDADAFGDEDGDGIGALNKALAFGSVGADYSSYIFKFGQKYTINLKSSYKGVTYNPIKIANQSLLFDENANNYNIIVRNNEFTPNRHGKSSVAQNEEMYESEIYSYYDFDTKLVDTTSYDSTSKMWSHKITPIEGIPFNYYLEDKDGKKYEDSNIFSFIIQLPEEYDGEYVDILKKAAYENQIKNAGGFILSRESNTVISASNLNPRDDLAEEYIAVAFPALPSTKGYSFSIQWEPGFVENFTVDLKDAQLEANLMEAVAPKAVKFNAVNTKMYVGETQSLDVTVTKLQLNDIVYLNYSVDKEGSKYLSVDKDTGVVTALKAGLDGKPGKAVVSVYPVKLNKDGAFEAIAGFKPVTVNITVSSVAESKITSVYTYDKKIDLTYSVPDHGYRREIYIVEGKDKTVQNIEALIDSMGVNKFQGAVMFYIDDEVDDLTKYDAKKKTYTCTLGGLKPDKDYTVYVRNVSGVRTLDDGSVAVDSHAGTVKSFRTQKTQLDGMSFDFTKEDWTKKRVENKKDEDGNTYTAIDLSAKTVQLTTEGSFEQKVSDPSAEAGEKIFLPLPLKTADKNYYCDTKLSYYVVEDASKPGNSVSKADKDADPKTFKDFNVLIGTTYYKSTKIAQVSNKGKVTLKGIGKVTFFAYDSVSKKVFHSGEYVIEASVGKITGKNITMKQGDVVNVYDYLTFADKSNKKIAGAAGIEEAYPIEISSSDSSVWINPSPYILATKANKKDIVLTVRLKKNPSIKTTLKVTTKAMDAVKGLKAVDVVDDQADFEFTYQGTSDGCINTYKIELRDQRGSLVKSEVRYVDFGNDFDSWSHGADVDEDLYIIRDPKKSNCAKGIYAFRFKITGLNRLSTYEVIVTPVYNDDKGKASKAKAKTTNIPVSYANNTSKKNEGSMGIFVRNNKATTPMYMSNAGYYTSGNVYTLIADPQGATENNYAFIRKTDKLTWKSTNTKVATVKPLTGTLEAELKAKATGVTAIEVTSSITKKLIARYYVRVKSIGNAGIPAYGDGEPIYDLTEDEMMREENIITITEVNPVKFKTPKGTYDYRWVSFTAPYEARFWFYDDGTSIIDSACYKVVDGKMIEITSGDTDGIDLEEGEKIYFKVTGEDGKAYAKAYVASLGKTERLSLTRSIDVEPGSKVKFLVPQDDFYVFSSSVADNEVSVNYGSLEYLDNAENGEGNEAVEHSFKKDREISLTDFTKKATISVNAIAKKTVPTSEEKVSLKSGAATWYKYTAKADGQVKLELKADASDVGLGALDVGAGASDIRVTIYGSNMNKLYNKAALPVTYSTMLSEDDSIWVEIENASSDEEAAPQVATIKITEPVAPTEVTVGENTVKIDKDDSVLIKFVIPEDNTEYKFNYTDVSTWRYRNNVKLQDATYAYSGGYIYSGDTNTGDDIVKKGDAIYVSLYNDTSEAVNAKVNIVPTECAVVKTGDSADVTLQNGKISFFKLNADAPGLYEFKASVKKNEEPKQTHSIDVNVYSPELKIYDKVSNQYISSVINKDIDDADIAEFRYAVSGVIELTKEDIAANKVFGISPVSGTVSDDEQTSVATISLKKLEIAELPTTEITLAKGETKYYKYTPKATGSYIISRSNAEKVKCYLVSNSTELDATDILGMNAGETVIFKVKNIDTAEQKTKFEPLVLMDKQLEVEKEFKISSNSIYNVYQYTFAKKGRYTVKVDVKDKDTTEADFSSWAADSSLYSISLDEYVIKKPYATINFDFEAYKKDTDDAVGADITVTIEEVVPTELPTTDIELEKGEHKYFKWTVPETGRYDIKFTEEKGHAIVEYAHDSYWPNDIVSTLFETTGRYFVKGQVYNLLITNADPDEKEKIKVDIKPTKMTSLTLNTASDKAEIEKAESSWYRLDNVKAGTYEIVFDSKTGLKAYIYENAGSRKPLSKDAADKYVYRPALDKDVVYLEFENNSSAKIEDFTVKVNKLSEIELVEGINTITGKSENMVYGYFKPTEKAFYEAYMYDISEDINGPAVSLCDEVLSAKQSVLLNTYSSYCYKLINGKRYDFTSYFESKPDKAAEQSYKIEIRKIEAEKVVLDTTVKADKTLKSCNKYYKFTAPESGRYDFVFTGSDDVRVDAYKLLMNSDGDSFEVWGLNEKSNFITKNSTVYFAVSYSFKKDGTVAPDKADLSVKVVKTPTSPITVGDNEATIKYGDVVWCEFTAPETALYSFVANEIIEEGSIPFDGVSLYDGMDKDYPIRSGNTITDFAMKKGSKIYYCCPYSYYGTSDDISLKITVSKREVPTIKVREIKNVTIGESGSETFIFEANKIDSFLFATANASTSSIRTKVFYRNNYGYDQSQAWYGDGSIMAESVSKDSVFVITVSGNENDSIDLAIGEPVR